MGSGSGGWVDQLLETPEVCGWIPIISQNLYLGTYYQLYWKDENK